MTVKGLLIRETDFGESDRYISVLTERGAKIEVLCRGVRRRGGRLTAAVRLFCWSELTLYEGRNGKYTLNDASIVHSFWGVTRDMDTYAMCCYLAELAGVMTGPEEETPDITRLFLYALYAVIDQNRGLDLVKAAFELRLMAECGFAPDLSVCGACQQPIEGTVYFSVREGAVLDAACCKRLGGGDFAPLPDGVYMAMAHVLLSEIPHVFSFVLGSDALRVFAGVCERYALYYAERGFHSLDFYHQLKTSEALGASPTNRK